MSSRVPACAIAGTATSSISTVARRSRSTEMATLAAVLRGVDGLQGPAHARRPLGVREAAGDRLAPVRAEPGAQLRVAVQAGEGGRERGGVARRHDEPGLLLAGEPAPPRAPPLRGGYGEPPGGGPV